MDRYENDLRAQLEERRRRRRPRKPPYKALAICAGTIFLLGFLTGFLIRGLFISKPTEPAEDPTQPDTIQTTEPVPSTEALAGHSAEDWQLALVNPWNAISGDLEIELAQIPNDRQVDKRCYDDLMAMLDAMEAEGLSYVVRSGYRTMSDQQTLYDHKVDQMMEEGYSEEDAKVEAGTVVAVPGTSEHQLGLAVDIVDDSYWRLDEKQESTPVQQWLMKNCWDYGFILRYPNDKSQITGIIYEPWHYRYVGREVAAEIRSKNLCLEEYLELLKG